MPKFIDSHPLGKLTPAQLHQLQNAPKDAFGVTHHDILFNVKDDRAYCVLNAPDRDAVVRHHKHAGIECEWVTEVESTRQ